jgi:phosphatidylinositol alpha-mannosyltransferase
MKIALVSPYDWAYPGGVKNHIRSLSDELQRMGHRITIVSPSSKTAMELATPNLITIGKPVPFPIAGSVARPTFSFHRSHQVRALLEEEEFDIVHLHEPLVSALTISFLRNSRTINVGTFHAYVPRSRGYRSARPFVKRWFRNLHGKIAVSQAAADLISRYFPGYYNIIPNGINLDLFTPDVRPVERYMDGKFNIVFVGRMEKRKGLRYLISAYGRLKWEYPHIRLLIVGPGKLDPASERVLGERLLDDVEIIGGVDYADLPRYYRTADLFVSPATGGESFGIVLLEAMATERPIIASNIPGYAGVLQHGAQGLLVEPQDDQALAAAIVELMQHPEQRRAMGLRGRQHAQAYRWPKVARQVYDYYERLLDERGALDPTERTP